MNFLAPIYFLIFTFETYLCDQLTINTDIYNGVDLKELGT